VPPPGNRTPEYVEATTCSPFLLEQIDVVQPKVIVALGGTAATYLLGVKQSLSSLRGSGTRCAGEGRGDVSPGVPAARSAHEGRGVEGPAARDGGDGAEGAGEVSVIFGMHTFKKKSYWRGLQTLDKDSSRRVRP